MLDKKKMNAGTVKEETENRELTPEELGIVSGGTDTETEAEKAKKKDGTLTPEI